MNKMKLKNKTYQPFQFIINESTHLVNARSDILIFEITSQIKKMEKKGFISVKLMR